jgi:branched-chain amino acid aminotransferase
MAEVDEMVSKQVTLPEKLEFGKIFTPHLFEMDYDAAKGGWLEPKIVDFHNLSLHPGALVLHYGLEIFEGLKAYRQVNGKIALFRPEKNFERLNRSAKRLSMPEVDIEMVLGYLKELIKKDEAWVPTRYGYSLYIRPLMIATDPILGVRPGTQFKFLIMLSPVGPYYPEGFKPVSIMATDKYVRAVRKGVGDCKTGGNYAASLRAFEEAQKEGYSQVLWLDAIEQKYIEEVGTMNMFVHFKDEVATAPLTGSILPGVTRDSVITILKDWGYNVQERRVAIDEVFERYEDGTLVELFGSGTAAVIAAISKLKFKDKVIKFSDTEPGELAQKLYDYLTGIQYGKEEDKYGWITFVD